MNRWQIKEMMASSAATTHAVTMVATKKSGMRYARKITGTSWNGPRFFGLRGGELASAADAVVPILGGAEKSAAFINPLSFRYEFDFWGKNRAAFDAALGAAAAEDAEFADARLLRPQRSRGPTFVESRSRNSSC